MKTVALVALLWLTTPVALAQQPPGSRRGYAGVSLSGEKLELRFVRWMDAILVDNVMVNGKGPYRFLLDTGAEGAGRVDSALVAELKLAQTGSGNSVGPLGEERQLTRHRLDTLAIGGLKFSGVEVSSRDYNAGRPRGLRPIHGILGFHLFSEYLLTINYPARTITVATGALPPADGKSVLAIISDDEDPEIEVRIGDQTDKALIDTGAMGPLGLPASYANKLKYKSEPVVRGREGGMELRSATLDGALRIGAIEVANPNLMLAEGMRQPLIGIQIIASLALTFDQKNARIRVERPPQRKQYGITTERRGEAPLKLTGVVAGGVAEAAGLRGTDRLIAINGRPVAELDREDAARVFDTSPLTFEVERDGKRQTIRMSLD